MDRITPALPPTASTAAHLLAAVAALCATLGAAASIDTLARTDARWPDAGAATSPFAARGAAVDRHRAAGAVPARHAPCT